MKYQAIAKRIIQLKNEDLKLRDKLMRKDELLDGYNPEMEALHHRNTRILNELIDTIGYPTIEKVGKKASQAAWLVIQHSISNPDFMRRCLQLLEEAVSENKADPKNLAYLTDRIAIFEGKQQLYGTQFDWDENGAMSPSPYDDLVKVNQRRKAIGFNTLEAHVEIIRKQAAKENQQPPSDQKKRNQQYNKWKKKVGWIK